jgi:ATP-dependent exoDNAse (exonuclease V) beta subunit
VLWRAVDPPELPRAQLTHEAASLPDADRLAREHELLCALRERAAARAARVFSTTASEEGHASEERAAAAAGDDESPPHRKGGGDDAERRVALAAGTALHAVLERLDWEDPESAQPAHALTALERAVASAAPPGEIKAVLARALSVWERFAAGPLLPQLRALAPQVVARELPVWVEANGDGPDDPVGFVAGAIDLLYRDPTSGELVVADYKTDAVAGAALDERAQSYAAQGAVYTRAVAAALGLREPPRFELWFLAAGELRTLRC